jgi:hypothetical protein
MRMALFLILAVRCACAQPKPPASLTDALRKLPGVRLLNRTVDIPNDGVEKKDAPRWPWVVTDLDHDGQPDVIAAVVKGAANETQFGVVAVHAKTPTQLYWVVPLGARLIYGVQAGGHGNPIVFPLYCIACDTNPFYRWSGHAYELELFSVGETVPIGSFPEQIMELFAAPRRISGIAGKVANCTEAKILATTGTSRESRWYQVEVRNPKLLRGWVPAASINIGACIG